MCYIYTKPELRDMSQGSRIAFARQFRHLSQDKVSDALGVSGECKRKTATLLLGEEYINAYVKDLSDDEAVIEMVDSNMYREKILPSEKAKAYKMKLDAIKHQGKKSSELLMNDITLTTELTNQNTLTTKLSKSRSNEIVGDIGKESR